MAKARLENGQVTTYLSDPKPFKIIEGYENGFTVGVNYWGGDALTDEDWEAFGFFPYTAPDYDGRVKEISSINLVDGQYVATVVDKTWPQTLSELKEQKISNLKNIYNRELSKTDWVIIRDSELGNTTDQTILDDRAALRAECATKEAEINALTTKKNVALYELTYFD